VSYLAADGKYCESFSEGTRERECVCKSDNGMDEEEEEEEAGISWVKAGWTRGSFCSDSSLVVGCHWHVSGCFNGSGGVCVLGKNVE